MDSGDRRLSWGEAALAWASRLGRGPPAPSPAELLLAACELGIPSEALAQGRAALALGAPPDSSRGSRAAAMLALAHGNVELALELHARQGSLSRPDAHGSMPLERALLDDDIPRSAKAAAVQALLGLGADPHGRPEGPRPLWLALRAGLDECSLPLLLAMPSLGPATELREMRESPLLAAALALGLPKSAALLASRGMADPQARAWLRSNAPALCLCCLRAAAPTRGSSSGLLPLALSLTDDPHAPLDPQQAARALGWLRGIPGADRGGSPWAYDSDPAQFALEVLRAAPGPAPWTDALRALGALPREVEEGLARAARAQLGESTPPAGPGAPGEGPKRI